jgi:hypothetical protein
VADKFVLVVADFPENTVLEEKVLNQNLQIMATYGVQSFPTVIFTDAAGREYGRHGYAKGGPEPWLKALQMRMEGKAKLETFLASLKDLEGVEKAKAIDTFLTGLDAEKLTGGYLDLAEEVIALDKDNAAGLRDKYQTLRKKHVVQAAEAYMLMEEWDLGISACDELIETHKATGEFLQDLLYYRAACEYGTEDFETAKETLTAALAAADDGALVETIKGALKVVEDEIAKEQE